MIADVLNLGELGEELHDSFLAWHYENHLRPGGGADRRDRISGS